jgi:Dyp-type peroxidase family
MKALLSDVQANILKGHGRNHICCIFIGSEKGLRNWIINHSNKITSAENQNTQTKRYKDVSIINGNKEELLTCFFISKKGYDYLSKEKVQDLPEISEGFNSGISESKDPWIDGRQEGGEYQTNKNDIYGMVLLAYNDKTELQNIVIRMFSQISADNPYHIEYGLGLKKDGQSIEHFGYADGISQPKLFNEDGGLDEEKCRKLVIDEHNGSFLVFRKLKQDVEHFNSSVKTLAKELGVSMEMAGAQIIGRFKNGTPLTQSKDGNLINNLGGYGHNILLSDSNGRRCPLHAHIRKTNTRRILFDGLSMKDIEEPWIVRRGMPYGEVGADDVGLLFMCYQKNIKKQFETIQSNWCNNPDFPQKGTGIDPLIGQVGKNNGSSVSQKWNLQWAKIRFPFFCRKKCIDSSSIFSKSVILKGSAYLYAPSMTIIEKMRTHFSPKQNASAPWHWNPYG